MILKWFTVKCKICFSSLKLLKEKEHSKPLIQFVQHFFLPVAAARQLV